MNKLEQLWRERIDWVQASGLTIAAASAERGVSVASVYRWKKLPAASPVSGRHRARSVMRTAGATKFPLATLPFPAVQVRGDDRRDSAATPSEALAPSRTALRIVLPNGVVIHVAAMLSLPSRTQLFLCTEPVDMRKRIL